jgi:5-methylcytosine-specific restriction protein B
LALYVGVRDANRSASITDEDEVPPPDDAEEAEEEAYWFAGAMWNRTEDQLPRFRAEGIWENGWEDRFSGLVRRIKPGDRIAVKSTFVQRRGLPFDVGGDPVSAMRIKATGLVIENLNDGKRVRVAWDPTNEPRDWYFYTYRTTLIEADTEDEAGQRLVNFTFRGVDQDYSWFLARPYWAQKYRVKSDSAPGPARLSEPDLVEELVVEDAAGYTVDDIVADGSFLEAEELGTMLKLWRSKKNMVLQGPPGTGKTWLAKRLGFALVGSKDRETARSRLRVVQFHPSLAYEDFVRGWRPSGEGRLSLVDGILLQAIEAATSEPDRPFVLVIEEINRGNPAQIFGEMLTLLEDTKRKPSEAVELAYRKQGERGVYIPKNLYIIGTMNVADRSLAIVDYALRRRFVFRDLEPRMGPRWRAWCSQRGIDNGTIIEIEARICALNLEIAEAVSLGPQFRIGHSYVTPDADVEVKDGRLWFRAKVEAEIGPLLGEYWYDTPERAREACAKLLLGF